VVGTSLWFNNVLPQFKALNDGIERLANNEPSFESVIAKRPQLVAAELEWVVGPQGVVGTREQFHELKIPTYLLPSDCEAKNNRVGADGTRLEPFRIDTIYKGIRQLAEIFDVQDRGQQLNDELKARLAKSVATVQGTVVLDGDDYMRKRPIGPLLATLGQNGIQVDSPTGCPPVTVHGVGKVQAKRFEIDGGLSSQYVSALLMLAACGAAPIEVALTGKDIAPAAMWT